MDKENPHYDAFGRLAGYSGSISLCKNCNSMTHSRVKSNNQQGHEVCGKCGAEKNMEEKTSKEKAYDFWMDKIITSKEKTIIMSGCEWMINFWQERLLEESEK